jgi:hypothetical protein
MTGKSKVVNSHRHDYYPMKHKTPKFYHGNGYNNTYTS